MQFVFLPPPWRAFFPSLFTRGVSVGVMFVGSAFSVDQTGRKESPMTNIAGFIATSMPMLMPEPKRKGTNPRNKIPSSVLKRPFLVGRQTRSLTQSRNDVFAITDNGRYKREREGKEEKRSGRFVALRALAMPAPARACATKTNNCIAGSLDINLHLIGPFPPLPAPLPPSLAAVGRLRRAVPLPIVVVVAGWICGLKERKKEERMKAVCFRVFLGDFFLLHPI